MRYLAVMLLATMAHGASVGTLSVGVSNQFIPRVSVSSSAAATNFGFVSNVVAFGITHSWSNAQITTLSSGSMNHPGGLWTLENVTTNTTTIAATNHPASATYTAHWINGPRTWSFQLSTNDEVSRRFTNIVTSYNADSTIYRNNIGVSNLFAVGGQTNMFISGTTRNANCIGGPALWTGIADKRGAMVTKRHWIGAAHNSSYAVGTTFNFYNSDNTATWSPVTVTNASVYNDIIVHEFNEDAPAWVTIYALAPSPTNTIPLHPKNYYGFNVAMVGVHTRSYHYDLNLVDTLGPCNPWTIAINWYGLIHTIDAADTLSTNQWLSAVTNAFPDLRFASGKTLTAQANDSSAPLFYWNGTELLLMGVWNAAPGYYPDRETSTGFGIAYSATYWRDSLNSWLATRGAYSVNFGTWYP